MLINKVYRYELKPNNKQCTLLDKCFGVSRFVYNWGLAQRIEIYKTKDGKDRCTNYFRQEAEFVYLKQNKYRWMYAVPKDIPRFALKDLDISYNSMYKNIKNKENKIGKPKFRKKWRNDSFRINNDHFNQKVQLIEVKGSYIKLPKISWIRVKESTIKLQGKILYIVVNRESNKLYISLCVEINMLEPKKTYGDIVGVDLGIKCFATISNGREFYSIQSPKPLRNRINKVRKLHQKLSHKKKCSKNRAKAIINLSKLYMRIRNIRKDFISKETTKLAKTKSVIVIEDLNIKGMSKNHHLARSITDEGWGEFKRQLEYKTQWYGSILIKVNMFAPTSKTCNHCGLVNKDLKLSERTWVCPSCGTINERDENAAKNIRDIGIVMLDTESLSELKACGVDVRPSSLMAVDCESGIKQLSFTKDKSY